ncbi:MAG: GGDEF domain-containing protein [Parasphingorhabdus sp.]|nr:GGDEF domain-containing protein [Parasphingorhabdus sp.]
MNIEYHAIADPNCSSCRKLQAKIQILQERLADLERQAWDDTLTGLANRRHFIEMLEQRIARCKRYGDSSALLFLDVNELKLVNDSLGHAAGDVVLRALAKLIADNIRRSDFAARIGGDEFAIILDNLDADQVEAKIGELMTLMARSELNFEGQPITLRAAIGYCFVGPTDNVEGLMSRADAAMYEVKRAR